MGFVPAPHQTSFGSDQLSKRSREPNSLLLCIWYGMVSGVDAAKRALVALLRILAGLYGCVFNITRDSEDAAVKKAYPVVSRKVHPDRGGSTADQTRLNWRQRAVRSRRGHGGRGGGVCVSAGTHRRYESSCQTKKW